MAFFTDDFLGFLTELKENNNKEWFSENKKRFETSVKKPFEAFINRMIELIAQDDPSIQLKAKDAIFRIYRDVRFSKDKTPYKTHMSGVISPGGRKNYTIPGIYLEFNTNEIRFYGGMYQLDKDQLYKVRTVLSDDIDGVKKLLSEPHFLEKFGEMRGEQHKRIPKEFAEAAKALPLLANKQYYYFAKIDNSNLTNEHLDELLMEYYFIAKPVMMYFREIIEE